MTDGTLSQAIREAYASAPAGDVIYHTLEIWHPAFTQPIRVVRDYEDLTATLEDSAPRDPGGAVTFTAFAFDFTRPEVGPDGAPQCTIEMDAVGGEIYAQLEAALATTDLIEVLYREFLSSDLSAPQNDPPLALTLLSVSGDALRVRATAGFGDLVNRRFPGEAYTAARFPGLVAA